MTLKVYYQDRTNGRQHMRKMRIDAETRQEADEIVKTMFQRGSSKFPGCQLIGTNKA